MATKPDIIMPILQTKQQAPMGGPELILENLWPEVADDQMNVPYTLHNPPGVTVDPRGNSEIHAAWGEAKVTGLFSQDGIFEGALYVFTEEGRLRVLGSDRNGTAFDQLVLGGSGGTMATNGTRATESAAIRGFVNWIEGNTAYTSDGVGGPNIQPVANLPDTVVDVAALSKRFFWIDGITDTVYYSDLGTTTHNPLNFFTAETLSDVGRSIYEHEANLYVSGTQTTEIYRTSPDYELPVAYTGITLPFGAPSPAAWADTMGRAFTIGQTAEGGRGIYLIQGGNFEKISPHWLDRRLELLDGSIYELPFPNAFGGTRVFGESRIDNCVGNAYTVEGHPTYELFVPGYRANGIDWPAFGIAYDVISQSWYMLTRESGIMTGETFPIELRFHAPFENKSYFADNFEVISEGQMSGPGLHRIGYFDRHALTYMGWYSQRRRWSIFQSQDRVFQTDSFTQQMNMVELNPLRNKHDNVLDPVPKAALQANGYGGLQYEISDDLGLTWRPDLPRKVLTIGYNRKYGYRATARRLGETRQPGRIYRFSFLYDCNIEVGPVFINRETLVS